MSEAKFTRGEWYVNCIGAHWDNPELAKLEICFNVEGECIVDHVYSFHDAHLIAAAPEMYEMLEWLETLPSTDDGGRAEIRNLLAKARGES